MFKIHTGRVKGDKKKPTFNTKKSSLSKKPYKAKGRNRTGRTKKNVISDSRLKDKVVKLPGYKKWFHEVLQPPCYVCGSFLGIEFHHVKEHSTDERVDEEGMALCHKHHHGTELSPHGTPVKFKEVYPMNVQYENAADMFGKYRREMLCLKV